MGLFNLFSGKTSPKYDMDTLEGINAIPVPAKNYNTGDSTKDYIYYILQRKATEHKKAGQMDLAIACLRKSNALSDYEERPPLMESDYLRLVKYLRSNGQEDLANFEEQQIYRRHPEFKNKMILNSKGIEATMQQNKELKNDLVIVNTNQTCPICKKYDKKIYSISGKSKKYPKLPKEIIKNGGFCPNCYLYLASFFEGLSTPPRTKNEAVYLTINGHEIDIRALYDKYPQNKVSAIKEFRKAANCSLSEAKKYVDNYYSQFKQC